MALLYSPQETAGSGTGFLTSALKASLVSPNCGPHSDLGFRLPKASAGFLPRKPSLKPHKLQVDGKQERSWSGSCSPCHGN